MKISKTDLNRLRRLEERKPPAEDAGAAIERLKVRLEQIAARLRASPGWREPTAAESAASFARLMAELRERGLLRVE